MFSQISRIPDSIQKFLAKRCGLYAGVVQYVSKPATGKTNQADKHSLCASATEQRFKQVNTLTMATVIGLCLNIMIGLSYE